MIKRNRWIIGLCLMIVSLMMVIGGYRPGRPAAASICISWKPAGESATGK